MTLERRDRMPLVFVECNQPYTIKRVLGNDALKRQLEHLGIVNGSTICILSKIGEDLIVLVKGTRLALNRDLAHHIHV